jgi:serine protease inhibitor
MKNKLLTQAVKSMSAVLLAAVTLTNVPGCVNAGAVKSTEPVYPKMAQYPGEDENGWDKWNSSRRKQLSAPEGYCDSLWSFYGDSSRTYLSGTQENRAYSPVSLYMALSMLAECTSGESRSQILGVMNAPDIETLRTQAGQVWNANYCDDGAIKSVLANSVWLSDDLETNSGTIGTLAKSYYASAHSGEFGSDEMTQAIRGWLNEQTGGMLNDAVSDVAPDASTLMALYSTVWFKGRWDNEFNKQLNDTRTFHAPSGDVQAEFMNQSFDRSYYWGEDFGAVKQPFVSGCDMWLILPDEDKSVSDVLDSGNYLSLLTDGYDYENSRTMKVNLALPKFDVTSTIDLREGLTELGITDVFSENADFSELCSSELYVNSARQSARVTIDEEGCTAAAFTEMLLCGSACPPANIQEIDFVLDRPFLFVITGLDGQPLFVGTVFNV